MKQIQINSPQRYQVSELIPQVMLVTLPTGSSQLLRRAFVVTPFMQEPYVGISIGIYLPKIKKDLGLFKLRERNPI